MNAYDMLMTMLVSDSWLDLEVISQGQIYL